jgi:hypothetical protein
MCWGTSPNEEDHMTTRRNQSCFAENPKVDVCPPRQPASWLLLPVTLLVALLMPTAEAGAQVPPAYCSGDRSDGFCPNEATRSACSGVPGHPRYDVDCFTCDVFPSPSPAQISHDTVHEGINRVGVMCDSGGAYDDEAMRSVILAYWNQEYWDIPVPWGANALDGYVVYAVARAALTYSDEVESNLTTLKALECMLHDHASRPIPSTDPPSGRAFHGEPPDSWDTRSEDYMSFALGCAGADAWFLYRHGQDYDRRYLGNVTQAVDQAFTVREVPPHALRTDVDPNPTAKDLFKSTLLRNHDAVSPVYATAIIRHIGHLNTIYAEVGQPHLYDASNRPATLYPLYYWIATKIAFDPDSSAYVYTDGACQDRWGGFGCCDDCNVDPREPAHYPLAGILQDLGIYHHLEYFSAPCGLNGAVHTQAYHNYYYNCVW